MIQYICPACKGSKVQRYRRHTFKCALCVGAGYVTADHLQVWNLMQQGANVYRLGASLSGIAPPAAWEGYRVAVYARLAQIDRMPRAVEVAAGEVVRLLLKRCAYA